MGKHADDDNKLVFLVHLQYVSCAETTRRSNLGPIVAKDLKARAGVLILERAKAGLPPLSLKEQVTRKKGSGTKPRITEEEVTNLLETCTLNKKQRSKL
jgi:hypothetical protein